MSQFSDLHASERTALRRNSVLVRPWGNMVFGADEPGAGMPCLFLHGHGGDRRDYARLLTRLPEIRAIAMDFAGHGQSSMPPAMTLSGLAADAVALLDHLKIETADVIGHSLGGMAALSLLERHSGRVARAILIEGWTALSFARVVAKDILERLDPTDAQGVAEKRRHTIDRWDPTVHEQFWRTVAAADATTVLSHTATPVLEIYGDRDRPRPTGEQFGVPDRPAIKLAWIAGAGHYPHLSHPDVVAELVRAFLE